MHKSEWREYTEDGRKYRIRAEFGWQKIEGNAEAYWSVTGEIQSFYAGYFREDCCGCIHPEISKHFPELAKSIRWHLTSQTLGPMHYYENAKYWLEFVEGKSKWKMDRTQKQCLEYFKNQVIFGALEDDTMPTLENLEEWCRIRLARLTQIMLKDTEEALKAMGVAQ